MTTSTSIRIKAFAAFIFLYLPLLIYSFPSAPAAQLAFPRNGPAKRALSRSSINPTLQLLNATQIPPISSLLSEIPYKVDGTPISLYITLQAPPIPQIYLNAFLTTVLRHIAPNVRNQRDGLVPHNSYMYGDSVTDITFAYTGLLESDGLTWQMLSWTLEGLLRFVNEKEEHCRVMMARVGTEQQGQPWSPMFGILVLRYHGLEGMGEHLA